MLIEIKKFKQYFIDKNIDEIYIEFKGLISTNLIIKTPDIKVTEDDIILFSKQNICESIKLNLHQIMKIEKINSNLFNIKFDNLQIVTILLKKSKQ